MNSRPMLMRRTAAVIVDGLAWFAVWTLATCVTSVAVGVLRVDDTGAGYGVMIVAALMTFLLTLIPLLLVEAWSGASPGRIVTFLRVAKHGHGAVSRRGSTTRALLKYGVVAVAIASGAWAARYLAPGEESLLVTFGPLLAYAIANAAACVLRRDRRSILDLITGSRTIAA